MINQVRIDAIALDANDNVATLQRPVSRGARVTIQFGKTVRVIEATKDYPLCHKIALADLELGIQIFKHGAVIGEATSAITCGGWVHVHSMRSFRAPRETS